MINEIIIGIIIVVLGIVLYFGFIKPDNPSPSPTPTPIAVSTAPTNTSLTVRSQQPTNTPGTTATAVPSSSTMIKTDYGFSFELPNTWRIIRDDGIGIGLLPNEIYDADHTKGEIMTLFTRQSSESPKEWSINFNGLGYTQEMELEINGNPAFYSVYEREEYIDMKYVVSNGSKIVATNFRKISVQRNTDNTKYIDEMEAVAKSIRFTE